MPLERFVHIAMQHQPEEAAAPDFEAPGLWLCSGRRRLLLLGSTTLQSKRQTSASHNMSLHHRLQPDSSCLGSAQLGSGARQLTSCP